MVEHNDTCKALSPIETTPMDSWIDNVVHVAGPPSNMPVHKIRIETNIIYTRVCMSLQLAGHQAAALPTELPARCNGITGNPRTVSSHHTSW